MEEAKNKDIFIQNYKKYSNNIYRFCLSRVSDHEQVLDIVQDTFTKYWKYLVKGNEIGNHKTLLFTISNNLIIDWYKKKKTTSLDKYIEKESESGEYVDDSVLRSDDQIIEKTEVSIVIERINELDEKYKTVVYLRLIEGLKPKEIAELIGRPVNNVSVDIHRGIKIFRDNWNYYEKE